MDNLVTIENVDEILEAVAKTPITDDPCLLFIEDEQLHPELTAFIKKSSASDTDVALTKFLIEKEHKKYNVGLSIKMWLNWDDVKVEDKNFEYTEQRIEDLKKTIDLVTDIKHKTIIPFLTKKLKKKMLKSICL